MSCLAPIELPRRLRFDWLREYGPLWQPGSTAFWLAPEAGDLEPGVWPLPFTIRRDLPTYEDGEWWHDGCRVTGFNYCTDGRRGHIIVYADYRKPCGYITDFDLGMATESAGSRLDSMRRGGYLGRSFWTEQKVLAFCS